MRKIFIKAMSLLLAAGISLSVSTSASAYSLCGWELEQPQINCYYDNWVASEAKTAALAAEKAWQRAVSSVEFGSQGTLVIFADCYRTDVGWDGLTSISHDPGSIYITNAIISLNSAKTTTWNSASALQSVAVHELGHVLGLDDLYDGSKAIMNGYTEQRYWKYNLTTPQPDDINGVNYLYE